MYTTPVHIKYAHMSVCVGCRPWPWTDQGGQRRRAMAATEGHGSHGAQTQLRHSKHWLYTTLSDRMRAVACITRIISRLS
jgi:hypothetical protein